MFSVFSIVPIAIIISYVLLSLVVIAMRYNDRLEKTIVSLIFNIIGGALAIFVTRGLVNLFISKHEGTVLSVVGDLFGEDLIQVESVKSIAMLLVATFLSVMFVGIVYFIITVILFFVKNKFVCPKLKISGQEEYDPKLNLKKVLNALVTAISICITYTIFITPFGVIFNKVPMVLEQAEVAEDLPELKKIPFVSEFYFEKLTETTDNGEKVSVNNEIDLTLKFAVEVEKVINGRSDKLNEEVIEDVISKAHYLPNIIPDIVATGAKHWKNGEEFLSFQYDVPEGREGKLYLDALSILEDWDKKSVIEDIETSASVLELLSDNDITDVNDITDKDKLLSVLSDEKFLEDLFVKLYKNKDFARLIPGVVEYGIGTTFDKIGIDLYSHYNSKVDITKLSEDQIRTEAKIVAGIIKSSLKVYEMSQNIQDVNEYIQKIQELVEEVSNLKDSEIWGDIATEIGEQFEEKFGENLEKLKEKINEFGGKLDSLKFWEE